MRKNPASPDSARKPLGRILVIVVVLACGLLVFLRGMSGQKPFEARGLKLIDAMIHLPTASFKTLDLVLPCGGTLSIEIAVAGENNIGVFVVAPDELVKMKAQQTFAHLDGFDANRTQKYRRSARLGPGRYGLVLMDQSPGQLSSSITDIQVTARLVGLK